MVNGEIVTGSYCLPRVRYDRQGIQYKCASVSVEAQRIKLVVPLKYMNGTGTETTVKTLAADQNDRRQSGVREAKGVRISHARKKTIKKTCPHFLGTG